jgi:hypothetical protein
MLFLRAKRRGNEFTKESFAAFTKAQMSRKIGERWGEQRCERGVPGEISPANHRCECKLSRRFGQQLEHAKKTAKGHP